MRIGIAAPQNWTHKARFYRGNELMREMWWTVEHSFQMDMDIVRKGKFYSHADWWTPNGEHGTVYAEPKRRQRKARSLLSDKGER